MCFYCINLYTLLHILYTISHFIFFKILKSSIDNLHMLTPKGPKNLMVKLNFYKYSHFIYAILSTVVAHTSGKSFIDNVFCILLYTSSLWSLVFFLQIVPSFGHFVMVIQRMLLLIFHFTLVYLTLMAPFAHVLYRMLALTYTDCRQTMIPTQQFLHRIFSIALNIEDVRTYGLESGSIFIFHFAFTLTISILLVNFLIAILTNEVNRVMKNRHLVMKIQQFAIVRSIETSILRNVRFLMKLYSYHQRKYFLVKHGKVYIVIDERSESKD